MAAHVNDAEGEFARRQKLYQHIKNGTLSQEVVNELLPQGEAHLYEKDLWDYKQELPTLPSSPRPSDGEKQAFNAKIAEIVKDVVAFYNSYGGYLLIGVKDHSREL